MTWPQPPVPALAQRLRAAAEVVLDDCPAPTGDAGHDAAVLLGALVELARTSPRSDLAWLLLAAVSGHLPLSDDVEDLLRHLELAQDSTEAEIWVLRHAKNTIAEHGEVGLPIRVLSGTVVVDVNFSAQYDVHTGIQRVTREVCPRWNTSHALTLISWTSTESAMRTLAPHEEARVISWRGRGGSDQEDPTSRPTPEADGERMVVVPWRCTIVLPEVTQGRTSLPLAALAQYSGNTVAAIGYDAIPVVSADLRPPTEPSKYATYLTVIKHATRVAGISTSATAEFRGFADAVRAQGIPGPRVAEVLLAAEVPPAPPAPAQPAVGGPQRPHVLCVGSHEPHKNHLAVLHAAELLWREGLDFDLAFVGGRGWDVSVFEAALANLMTNGRPVTNLGPVTDHDLWAFYRGARFTVFPSLHEGFGLPVAESLACGTPAITTRYGSTGEIAERGGCLLIDPRDDHDLADAMRTLLTDPETYRSLKEQAQRSTVRTWDAYASDLWAYLVDDDGVAA